jgi:hypothetical protein
MSVIRKGETNNKVNKMGSGGEGWKREKGKEKYEKVIIPEDHLNSITKMSG